MKLSWKKVRVLAMMLCFSLVMSMSSFASYAEDVTQINVIFSSKGGTLKVTRDGQQEGPYESWGDMFEAGSTVSESVSIDEVTYWAADRALEGWLVGYDGIITDEEGNTYNSFV